MRNNVNPDTTIELEKTASTEFSKALGEAVCDGLLLIKHFNAIKGQDCKTLEVLVTFASSLSKLNLSIDQLSRIAVLNSFELGIGLDRSPEAKIARNSSSVNVNWQTVYNNLERSLNREPKSADIRNGMLAEDEDNSVAEKTLLPTDDEVREPLAYLENAPGLIVEKVTKS